MSSETFMKLHLQFHKVGVARFPNVAFLQACTMHMHMHMHNAHAHMHMHMHYPCAQIRLLRSVHAW